MELVELKNLAELDFIESITDKSDTFMKRIRVTFKNGYGLSIIKGFGSYGSRHGLFEIAVFDKDGEMTGELFDAEDHGDTVLSHCDIDKLNHYINKIGKLVENGIEHKAESAGKN